MNSFKLGKSNFITVIICDDLTVIAMYEDLYLCALVFVIILFYIVIVLLMIL